MNVQQRRNSEPSSEDTILREAKRLENNGKQSTLGKQLVPICLCMFGYTTAGVPVDVVSSSVEKTNTILKETLQKRKKYYKGSSMKVAHFHDFKRDGGQGPRDDYSPVKLPFRYVEEIFMMFSLVYTCIHKNYKTSFIVYPAMRRVMIQLKKIMKDGIPEKLYNVFFDGVERFDQKQLTKLSYVLYGMGEDKVNTFLKALFDGLEYSRIIASLFAYSYKYCMIDKREEIVKRSGSTAVVRAYKFDFDTFYFSPDAFREVLNYKQPKKRTPSSLLKNEAAIAIQKAFRKYNKKK